MCFIRIRMKLVTGPLLLCLAGGQAEAFSLKLDRGLQWPLPTASNAVVPDEVGTQAQALPYEPQGGQNATDPRGFHEADSNTIASL